MSDMSGRRNRNFQSKGHFAPSLAVRLSPSMATDALVMKAPTPPQSTHGQMRAD